MEANRWRRGLIEPNKEPWGRPQDIGAEEENDVLIETLRDLFNKYEGNQLKAGHCVLLPLTLSIKFL